MLDQITNVSIKWRNIDLIVGFAWERLISQVEESIWNNQDRRRGSRAFHKPQSPSILFPKTIPALAKPCDTAKLTCISGRGSADLHFADKHESRHRIALDSTMHPRLTCNSSACTTIFAVVRSITNPTPAATNSTTSFSLKMHEAWVRLARSPTGFYAVELA